MGIAPPGCRDPPAARPSSDDVSCAIGLGGRSSAMLASTVGTGAGGNGTTGPACRSVGFSGGLRL